MKMTVELFDNIINTSQDCVFWKDKDRRFLGVNQAFLDFYGFESADVLIGKTDEDMGWHTDPEPYMQDELRVLAGRSTYKVQGKCIIKGEERDIIASKRPLYDGEKIVGLVGSFVDITEVVRRKNYLDGSQIIYDINSLRKFDYFDKIIDEISLDEILDPLTGILSRAYSIKFVTSLIANDIPFTFTIVDLDNFKFINDSFGHSAGDKVLNAVSKGLAEYIGTAGLAGRFGGDELLLIDLHNIKHKDKELFFKNLYDDSDAMRINVDFENGSSFVTGTVGCATFPYDADNFTDLFGLIDKMLYLGKNRGRNCYTIYEKDKHDDIEIHKIAKNGIFTDMHNLKLCIENVNGFGNKLKEAMPLLKNMLQIEDLYYVMKDKDMKAVLEEDFNGNACDIFKIMTDDIFSESTLESVKKSSPVFYDTLMKNGFESVMIVRIRKGSDIYGYLICAVKRSLRIWQEYECAILYFLSELLSDEFVK
ncbi:MAG: GGDEF domain-containing protein [Lachnospiraceae bacterium]|nr:GGDEF domain-containing protein [Lachnospiraceae bacterium]